MQTCIIVLIWLLSPFASTTIFHHYAYEILPYQLTIACALVLLRLHDPETRSAWFWRSGTAALGLAIAWTGEAHLIASVIFLGIVAYAAPSTRSLRERHVDVAVAVLAIALAIAVHRWFWSAQVGHYVQARYEFSLPTFQQGYERAAQFIQSLLPGVVAQVIPIVSFARNGSLGSRLIKSTIQGLQQGRQKQDSCGPTCHSVSRCA
jgi:hypothetical protein